MLKGFAIVFIFSFLLGGVKLNSNTSAADCGQYRQAARVVAPDVKREAEEDWGK